MKLLLDTHALLALWASCPALAGEAGSLDILHANGVQAYQPRATPWEKRRIPPTRPATAGAVA